MKFGIAGFGRFGQLWAKALLPFGKVYIWDKNPVVLNSEQHIEIVTLPDIAQADVVFISVPISELEKCCSELKPYLQADTLVADCCSVKVYPVAIMRKLFLPTQPIIATHPLFGPDSVRNNSGLLGLKMVLCPIQAYQHRLVELENILEKIGLVVSITTPEEHDQQMANSQGLVHYIGRGLSTLALQPQALATPDFQALLNINSMVMNDSCQLFLDMHRYNPYAGAIRRKFIEQLIMLEQEIDNANSETAKR